MKKTLWENVCRSQGKRPSSQFIPVMLSLIIASFNVFQLQAADTLDKEEHITLSFANHSLYEVLTELEKKTEYHFFYNQKIDITQRVRIEVVNVDIRTALNQLLRNSSLVYTIKGDQIVLKRKKDRFPKSTAAMTDSMSLAASTELQSTAYTASDYAITVTGRVIDADGSSLPGVSIMDRGTTNGTTTDSDGRYTIMVQNESSVLSFSFIGYASQDIPVGTQTTIDVTLAADTKMLGEVVVIGYQTVERKDLTGATSVIRPADAARVTANSVGESIQGLAPGVTVRTGGVPGQNAVVEIRGVASFQNSNPLYVIDGMIADANTTINSNDIESIQILKDASAAAIYGSRAANGVVIVTTKQGKEGPAKLSFSAKYGVQQMYKQWDVMNSTEFAAMQRTQYQNSGATPPASVAQGTFDPSINTDWQDQTLRTGSLQDYNMSLSGGTGSGSYLISGSYFVNNGYVTGNSFERGSLRINTRTEKGRVTIGENMVLTNSNTEAVADASYNPIYNMATNLPVIPVMGDRYISATNPGGWGIGTYPDAVTYAWNPVAVRNLSNTSSNFAKIVGNAFVEVKIFDWLTYRFNTGLEASFDYTKGVRKEGVWQYNAATYPSSVNEDRARFLSWLFDNTLNFNKTLGNHRINGVVGMSQQRLNRNETSAGRTNLQIFNNQYLTTINSAIGQSTATGRTSDDYTILGYLGRVNYIYNDKYLVTLTGRIDQDSRYGANYRRGFFPSAALAWRINKEAFFNVSWISELKLSASYGKLGFTPLGSWDNRTYINNAPRAIFGTDQTPNVGAYAARLSNPDLRWEERIQKNIGLDVGILEDRVSLSLAWYNSFSQDALLTLPVPGYLGNLQGNPYVNAASIRNQGFEFGATYRNNNHPVKWDMSVNATTIKNTVENVGNQGLDVNYFTSGNTRSQVGHSLGAWYVIKSDGLFQTQSEIDNYKTATGTVIQPYARPGDIRFIDKNGDGNINADDRQFVGSPWPKVQTGLQANASYNNFNINVQFVGVFDYTVYNDVLRSLDSYQNTNFRSDINPWSETNTSGNDPRMGLESGDQGIISNNRVDSDRWLENASYVRLRNIELGYKLPAGFSERAHVSNARVYVSAQNLFTITSYKGLDPDVTGSNLLERGVDNGHWPSPRVFSLGIQCEF